MNSLKGVSMLLVILVCYFVSSVSADKPEEGLSGCWNFEEGQGDIAKDISGKGNDAVVNGALWVKDESGSFLKFDGVSNSINCGNDSSLMPTDAITVEAWIKTPSQGKSGGCILIKRAEGTGYLLETFDGKIRFVLNPWTCNLVGNTDVRTGEWVHAAGTYDGNIVKVYVNGILDGSLEYKGLIDSNDGNLIIGYRSSAADSDYFNGFIDDVRIYSRALNADEIYKHYSQDRRVKKSGPI